MQNPFDDENFFFEAVYTTDFPRLDPNTLLLVFSDHDALAEIKRSEFATDCQDFLAKIKGKVEYFKPCWCGDGTEPTASFWTLYPPASFQALIGTQPFEDAIMAFRRSDQAEAAANAG